VGGGSPPALTVSATSVTAGGQVTVTLTNGPGGASDWLALAAVGAPDTSYLQSTSVGAGVTTRTWTVTLSSPGSYEFRLFLTNGTRAATSPTVTVSAASPPALTVSATSVAPGGQVTVTLTNGPGGALDWLVLAALGAPDTSYLQSTYVGAGLTTRTWTVTLASPGSYEFRLFLNNGYTRAATSPTVTVSAAGSPPELTVSATSVASRSQVTMTLANGTGGATAWLALAAVGAPNTSYLQFTYVGAGVTTRTWTVTLPSPGSYEFRLFSDSGYTRIATSPTVTVIPPTLSVSATSVTAGSPVTVTLTDGVGGGTDWLTVAVVGSPNTSYLQWTYVGSGVTTRTWTVTLASPGSYEFRLFLNGGYTRAATSPAVTVSP